MEKEFINIFDLPMTIISSVVLTADEQNGNNIKTTTIGDFVNPQQ